MTSVRTEVEQVGTRTLVRLFGDLTGQTAPRVRMALLKCLVEQPDAVVVDLAGLAVVEPAALNVFLAVSRQAAQWPGIPLALVVADPWAAEPAALGRLAVYRSAAEALDAPLQRRLPTITETLLPVSGATHRAREVAAEACARWELPHLADAARVVAGELVANAVDHTATMADLRFSMGRRYLLIAVRDGSTAEPRPDAGPLTDPATGRGLRMIEAMAHRWGSLPADGGKVVWASLPVR